MLLIYCSVIDTSTANNIMASECNTFFTNVGPNLANDITNPGENISMFKSGTKTDVTHYTPVTRRSVNAATPPRPKQTDCSVTFIILCVAVTRHDFCVTPSRLIEGTAARPSYDSPTNCVTGPRLAHDRHGIIILIHDRRTIPSRRFQDLCVTLLGYIKS